MKIFKVLSWKRSLGKNHCVVADVALYYLSGNDCYWKMFTLTFCSSHPKLHHWIRRDDDVARRTNINNTARSQGDSFSPKPASRPQGDSFVASSHNPLSSQQYRSSGTTTPPPKSRNRHSLTPTNNYGPSTIVRTNSHRSKSSSDGSWDTPTESPPHNTHSKPPHAVRTAPIKMSRRKNDSRRGSTGASMLDGDISEAVYTKFLMCGFTDAFNFDKFQKWRLRFNRLYILHPTDEINELRGFVCLPLSNGAKKWEKMFTCSIWGVEETYNVSVYNWQLTSGG